MPKAICPRCHGSRVAFDHRGLAGPCPMCDGVGFIPCWEWQPHPLQELSFRGGPRPHPQGLSSVG